MQRHIDGTVPLVAGYDEAIAFCMETLRFVLVEDTRLSDTKRWVVVTPPGRQGCGLLLAQAVTDDRQRDHADLIRQGVRIVRPPAGEAWAPFWSSPTFTATCGT